MRKEGNIVSFSETELDEIEAKEGDKTDWMRLRNMTDEEAEANAASDEDANWEWSDEFFTSVEQFLPKPKRQITLRLDHDVLEAFKADGPGYQTRINAVLRAYLLASDRKAS